MQSRNGTSIGWARLLAYALLALAVCLAPAFVPAFAAPATTYRIVQLSAQPFAGGDINAKGQVVFNEVGDDGFRAMYYDGRSIRNLGTLGGPSATAVALNDHGQVAGYSLLAPPNPVQHPFYWSAKTGMIDILGPGQEDVDGIAADINNRGQIAGTAGPNAFRWSRQTGVQLLPNLDSNSGATAINEAGTVVGFSQDPGGEPMGIPVRWTSPTDILALSDIGSRTSGARDINGAGHIVGNVPFEPNPFGADKAFLWTPRQGLVELFPDSEGFSSAFRINDRGMIIGLYPTVTGEPARGFILTHQTGIIAVSEPGVPSSALDLNNRGQVVGSIDDRAYVWSRHEGFVDLNTRLVDAPAGLVLTSAVGIAENGSILVSANTGLLLLVPNAAHPCPDK